MRCGDVGKLYIFRFDGDLVAGFTDTGGTTVGIICCEREMGKLAFQRHIVLFRDGQHSMQLLSPVEIIMQGYFSSPHWRTTLRPSRSR